MRKALFHSIESLDSKLKGVLHYDALLNDPVSFASYSFFFFPSSPLPKQRNSVFCLLSIIFSVTIVPSAAYLVNNRFGAKLFFSPSSSDLARAQRSRLRTLRLSQLTVVQSELWKSISRSVFLSLTSDHLCSLAHPFTL